MEDKTTGGCLFALIATLRHILGPKKAGQTAGNGETWAGGGADQCGAGVADVDVYEDYEEYEEDEDEEEEDIYEHRASGLPWESRAYSSRRNRR